MDIEGFKKLVEEVNPEALMADGFDNAIIGLVRRCGQPTIVAYDYAKCVDALMEQGLEYHEAVEWMEFNVVGAWLGENTPAFLWMEDDMERELLLLD